MPRGVQDVPCAICMDSLFCERNDLDEILPMTTTTCGHVFHEKCILHWFTCQQQTRRDAAIRAGRPLRREPGLLCPSCRSPCSKDLLTSPHLQRIYINIGGDGEVTMVSSSKAHLPSSSPFRGQKDQQVLALARRARDLQDEVGKFTVKSEPGLVAETLVKVESLAEELASDRALQSVKTYIGGLTKAVNTFRSTLEANPLATSLNKQIVELQAELSAHKLRYNEHLAKALPAAVDQARREERFVHQQRLAEEKRQRELIQAEYEKEKVARRIARSAKTELEADVAKKEAAYQAELKLKDEERQALATTLGERTKLLKFAQAKAEDRRNLKGKVKELEDEVARLCSEATRNGSKSNDLQSHASPDNLRRSIAPRSPGRIGTSSDALNTLWDDQDQSDEMDIQPIRYSSEHRSRHLVDESLQVDLPISEDSLSAPITKPSTTARTYAFDLDSPRRYKAGPSRLPSSDNSGIVMLPSVVSAGSKRPAQTSPGSKSRTNPFSAGQSSTRRLLKASSASTIHLGASTGVGKIASLRQPLQPKAGMKPEDHGGKANGKITGYLDLADANGRPKKGVVAGVKVRRLA